MTSRRESRKKAYHYIVAQVKKLNLNLDRTSEKITNDVDYISLNDLIGLKDGLTDPPQKLVVALKKLLKSVTNEVEIDKYLVKPFHNEA